MGISPASTRGSQRLAILNHLLDGNTLTSVQALEKFGCFRLAARIDEFRKAGHNIITETINRNGKEFARYHLIKGKSYEQQL